jgi:uncharacterized protein (TIGR02757 family)
VTRLPNVDALATVLERVVAACDVPARLSVDPVSLVRGVLGEENQEVVGLLAACLAFGNVTALRAAAAKVMGRLGPSPVTLLDSPTRAARALEGTGHRMLRADDITRLLVGARAMQRRHGRLGTAFAARLIEHGGLLKPALTAWIDELRDDAGLRADGLRRGPSHILPDPRKGSGCKRLALYLRWMVRRDEGVDLGLWRSVSPEVLLMPVDTHVMRISTCLGLTSCRTASWEAAEQITASLRRIDPLDPVRFDFAVCHLGMSVRCLARKSPDSCAGCPAQPACRHWRLPAAAAR